MASFIEDYDADRYGMSFALVADGLSNPTWLQSNSYAPREGQEPVDDPEMPGEIGYMFTHGTNPMPGLIYNDVVLAITSPEEYVLPKATIGEEVTASTEFDITSLHNTAGEQVVEDFSKVRCVAIVVDLTTNRPVNCISSPYLSSVPNSISKIETDSNPIFTEWYDLQGRKLSAPVNNAFIIEVRHFENGKIRCKKVRY